MTYEEAVKLANVAKTADGGCAGCVRDMCEQLTKATLGWDFEYQGTNAQYDHIVEVKAART